MFTNINRKSWKIFFGCFIDVILPCSIFVSIIVYGIASLLAEDQSVQSIDPSIYATEFEESFAITGVEFFENFSFEPPTKNAPSLEGEALYRSYISEIVETKYPDLDEDTVAAIVYHESRFQPDSVNKKTNATGLMQILPKWHTERAQNLGVTDLSDPYGNIIVGCDILSEIYQQSHSMDYALDFYAGGYGYANRYKNSVSPYRRELNEILQEHILGKE